MLNEGNKYLPPHRGEQNKLFALRAQIVILPFLPCIRAISQNDATPLRYIRSISFYAADILRRRPSTPQSFYAADILRRRHSMPQTFYAADILRRRHSTPKTFYAADILRRRHSTPQTFCAADIIHRKNSTRRHSTPQTLYDKER